MDIAQKTKQEWPHSGSTLENIFCNVYDFFSLQDFLLYCKTSGADGRAMMIVMMIMMMIMMITVAIIKSVDSDVHRMMLLETMTVAMSVVFWRHYDSARGLGKILGWNSSPHYRAS